MFLPVKSDSGAMPHWEYLPAAAGTYAAGQMLTVSASGQVDNLSAASTTTPPYLCMADVTAVAGQVIPVIRVEGGFIFETTLKAAASGAVIGTKLQVEADGLTASKHGTGSGTFEVVYLEGTAAGNVVRGRFV